MIYLITCDADCFAISDPHITSAQGSVIAITGQSSVRGLLRLFNLARL